MIGGMDTSAKNADSLGSGCQEDGQFQPVFNSVIILAEAGVPDGGSFQPKARIPAILAAHKTARFLMRRVFG